MSRYVEGEKEVLALIDKLGRSANKIIRKELRVEAKEVATEVKADVPQDTGNLSRSITVRAVKKKKRYDVAFHIVPKVPEEGPFYAFAPNYGVEDGPGHQPGLHFLEKGIEKAEARLPETLKRIADALRAEWRKT